MSKSIYLNIMYEVYEVIKYTQNYSVCHNSINSEHITNCIICASGCDKATSSSTPFAFLKEEKGRY